MADSLTLTVEVPPGANIAVACYQMQDLAERLLVTVRSQTNGVTCLALPGGSGSLLAQRQAEAQDRKGPAGKVVTSRV